MLHLLQVNVWLNWYSLWLSFNKDNGPGAFIFMFFWSNMPENVSHWRVRGRLSPERNSVSHQGSIWPLSDLYWLSIHPKQFSSVADYVAAKINAPAFEKKLMWVLFSVKGIQVENKNEASLSTFLRVLAHRCGNVSGLFVFGPQLWTLTLLNISILAL